MNALFLSNDPAIAHPDSPVRARMRAYAKEIGTLHVLVRSGRTERTVDGALTIHEIQTNRIFASLSLSRAARKLIRAEGVEIVSAQDPFEYGRAALTAVRGTNAKLHIQVHTDFLSPWFVRDRNHRAPTVHMSWKNRVRRMIADSVLPHADGIRVVSLRIKQSLIERYGKRIPEPSVIPIAVSDTLPAPVALPPHPFTFSLITVSRLEPEKRIEDILVALARTLPDFPAVGLFIVGEGSERKALERQVARLGLSDYVVFLGARADAWGLMQSATAYIQASAYEGYGLTLIEAALARLPIITTDVGIVGEVFRGYEEVFSVPPGDPAALSACIKSLVQNHQSREVLGRAAEAAARAHLSQNTDQPKRIAQDLAQVLARV